MGSRYWGGTYQDYLRSDHWRTVRKFTLYRQPTCEECGASDHLQVHHLTYDNLGDENPEDLKVLCKGCHLKQHPEHSKAEGFVRDTEVDLSDARVAEVNRSSHNRGFMGDNRDRLLRILFRNPIRYAEYIALLSPLDFWDASSPEDISAFLSLRNTTLDTFTTQFVSEEAKARVAQLVSTPAQDIEGPQETFVHNVVWGLWFRRCRGMEGFLDDEPHLLNRMSRDSRLFRRLDGGADIPGLPPPGDFWSLAPYIASCFGVLTDSPFQGFEK
jgi:hypothetical protein